MRRISLLVAVLSLLSACKSPPRIEDESTHQPPPPVIVPVPVSPPAPVIEPPREKPKSQLFTIVPGVTANVMFKKLRTTKGVNVTTPVPSDGDVKAQLHIMPSSIEGVFLPDAYRFAEGTSDFDLLKLANDRLNEELEKAWTNRDPTLPLKNSYELLILASIVEKETALVKESPIIAGVFVTRLLRGMRLQSDPTVIYGMGPRFTGNMKREDLRRDTPHNTYTRDGLPPTAICLPSLESIKAAANPKITGAIFFVVSEKGDGSHSFSKTLEEHNAAVQRYLKSLRQ